ncbi:hypothetical protein HanPI659440_Chr08g0292601 [Helianthus annuus]|nr:hypothetical protein HanPI659440_Chr08g0292601 [Helianthus annuus]
MYIFKGYLLDRLVIIEVLKYNIPLYITRPSSNLVEVELCNLLSEYCTLQYSMWYQT